MSNQVSMEDVYNKLNEEIETIDNEMEKLVESRERINEQLRIARKTKKAKEKELVGYKEFAKKYGIK